MIFAMEAVKHVYEVRPRKDHRGADLISDALPFGRLAYGEPDAITNAIDYAKFRLAIISQYFTRAAAFKVPRFEQDGVTPSDAENG